MYRLATTIPNDALETHVPEVAFSADGSQFAATYFDYDEVRLYDTASCRVQRSIKNPAAALDRPHAVLLTQNHVIVASRHRLERPATLTVYRLDNDSDEPVFTLETPLEHLREGHSMSMRGDIFVLTYTQSLGSAGVVLSYRFDDETGQIEGPLDCLERCFDKLGRSKGIAFSADGSQLFVNFNSDKALGSLEKLAFKVFKARNVLLKSGPRGLLKKMFLPGNPDYREDVYLGNGIAVFRMDDEGQFTPEPDKVLLREEFCRLENISISGDTVALADTINSRVYLFDQAADPELKNPVQTITEGLCLPHATTLSPDGQTLVISSYGLQCHNQLIHWEHYSRPRTDNVVVFRTDAS
jgi:hypothetical protein